MVGCREGWIEAPYASCPAGPADIAQAIVPVGLENGSRSYIIRGINTLSGHFLPDPTETIGTAPRHPEGASRC
jgi:2-keto-3-deoxy-galactonokinase